MSPPAPIEQALVAAVGQPEVTRALCEEPFAPAFASAGRRIGTAPVTTHAIVAAGLLVPAMLGADECARALLVLRTLPSVAADRQVSFVRDLVRRGETRERRAVLRVLAALPEPARFVDVAIDAYRTNIESVFHALACDNAYPAAWLPAAAFHQLVLKALFIGAPLARIDRLGERTTPELVRMVAAYASERRAAGRPVPEDAKLVTEARR